MLEAALAPGVAEGGGDAWLAGVLPTPAASILVRRHGLDLAAVVSASHNPWQHNGIKFFGPRRAQARRRARGAHRGAGRATAAPQTRAGRAGCEQLDGALDDYLRALLSAFRARPLRASGAARLRQRRHLSRGAVGLRAPRGEVESIGIEPDGRNINEGCGSVHPELLAERVSRRRRRDRVRVRRRRRPRDRGRRRGGSRDGDELIALCARHLADAGGLDGGVAVTVMSNYGFHRAMAEAGIEVATTPVGDRNVAAELERRGWALGGEQSGHIIWEDSGRPATGSPPRCWPCARSAEPTSPRPSRWKAPAVLENVEVAIREALEGAARGLGGGRTRERGARGPRPRPRSAIGNRASGPRHGGGPDRGASAGEVCGPARSLITRRARSSSTLFAPMCGIVGYVGKRPAEIC